jgi:Transposase DDE domain
MTSLIEGLVPNQLWAMVVPLLPASPRPPYGGRRRTIPDRNCFAAVVFMARTSTPVAPAPIPGAGLWLTGHGLAAAEPVGQGRGVRGVAPGDPGPTRRAGAAGLVARQPGQHERPREAWGDHVGASPVDRGKPGSKLHLVCDGGGLPLTAAVTAANVPDVVMLAALVDDIPPVYTPSGRRRVRPSKLDADKATTARPTAPGCAGAGSGRGSPDVGSSHRPGWGGIAGGWSGRCRG